MIELRNGIYYYRLSKSLRTRDREVAEQRAQRIRAAVDAMSVSIAAGLEAADPDDRILVCDVVALYRKGARTRGLRERTIEQNIGALHRVMRVATSGADPERQPVTLLGRSLAQSYHEAVMESPKCARGARKSESLVERARRSVRSTLNQARGVFARWALAYYHDHGLELAEIGGFLEPLNLRAPDPVYHRPDPALIERTLAEAEKLTGPIRVAFELCYTLGMRAGEAAACRREWMEGPIMVITRRAYFAPKGRGRRIPIDPSTMELLTRWGHAPELLGPSGYALVTRALAMWMRGIGWDAQERPKAAHELRKLRGSLWYTRHGAEAAQKLLGHVDVTTTCRYYAEFTDDILDTPRVESVG
jgi:integrase